MNDNRNILIPVLDDDSIHCLDRIGDSLANWRRADELTEINKTFIPQIAKTAFAAAKARQ